MAFFEEPRFREATRLMEVKLRLTAPDNLRFRRPLKAKALESSSVSPDPCPPLYFSGSSKGVNGNEALVEGTVRMGRDGAVRWQFVRVSPALSSQLALKSRRITGFHLQR